MTWNLIKWLWKMNLNGFKYSSDKVKTTLIISGVAIGLIVLMFSGIVYSMASSVPTEAMSQMLALSFLTLFAFLLLFAIPQVFSKLYGDDDLTMLFTLPLKSTQIYWAKFTQIFLGIPGLIFIVSLILLTVFGLGSGAPVIYYPVAYIVSFALVLMGLGIAYMINLLLIQLVPSHRAKELMTVITAFAGVLGYLLFQIPTFMSYGDDAQALPLPDVPAWLPVQWAGASLAQVITRSMTSTTVVLLALLILTSAAVLLFSSMLVDKGFRTGWIQMNEGRAKKHKTNKKQAFRVRSPIMEIGIKDWRMIKRDMREWTMLIPMAFFMFFPIFSIMIRGGSYELIQSIPALSWISLQAITLGLFSFMTSTFTSGSVSREGESIDLLRVLPIRGMTVALGKLWIHWVILLGFIGGLQIICAFVFGWSIIHTITGWLFVGAIGIGSSAVGLYFGAIGAKYNEKNPQNRLETGTSFILLFVAFGYSLLQAIPFALALLPVRGLLFLLDETNEGIFMTIVQWVIELKDGAPVLVSLTGLAISLALTTLVTWLFLTLAAKEIDRGVEITYVKG
ncbi:putative ABC transporter permease subunit [Bacillus sp. FJAT-45037]|uniref:putative ABC transporter permease subunit n=1 Tax=Bacillus sp. FJAT-45037 TaxID=2011007 RepID=UPI000C24E920|nr:hypothetical protein [Bacillus sp. FJAT-45037]